MVKVCLGQQDGVSSECGVVAIVAELAVREQRMVGHSMKNIGVASNGGQRREESVGW